MDVNLIEAHPQGIRSADDAHRVADAFQFTAQRARLSGSGVKQVHDLELPGRGRLHSITRPGDPMRGAGHEIDEHLMATSVQGLGSSTAPSAPSSSSARASVSTVSDQAREH